ncbi:hypothetical protein ES703_10194 [subsurface metagenome]
MSTIKFSKMDDSEEGGLTYQKIANRFGLSSMTVYNHLWRREKPGLIGRLKRRLGLGYSK